MSYEEKVKASDAPTFRYFLDRLEDVKTQSDLNNVKQEIRDYLPLDRYEENFDVQYAVDNVKRDYVLRALSRTKNVSEAAKLLGLKNYQTLQNWMDKLGVSRL